MNTENFDNNEILQETAKEAVEAVVEEITEETEVKEPTFNELFAEDLTAGFHSVLYKRIGSVNISDIRLKNAFSFFLENIDCGKTLSVAEIIYSAEALLNKKLPDDHCENRIYVFDTFSSNAKIPEKVLASSVNGFYALPNLHNGFALDLSAFGGRINNLESMRFIVAPLKKIGKLVALAARSGFNCTSVGSMLASEEIVLTNCGETVADFCKSAINAPANFETVCLTSENFADYLNGFNTVTDYVVSGSISNRNLLKFSLSGGINAVFARALGYFSAIIHFKLSHVNFCFVSNEQSLTLTPYPHIGEGTYLYFLKVRNDAQGIPDKQHVAQLISYVADQKRFGKIKDALPMRKNILDLLYRISGEELEYTELDSIPADCYGIIVSAERGESVNGVKIGYYSKREEIINIE